MTDLPKDVEDGGNDRHREIGREGRPAPEQGPGEAPAKAVTAGACGKELYISLKGASYFAEGRVGPFAAKFPSRRGTAAAARRP
jgi:hypothetical protein